MILSSLWSLIIHILRKEPQATGGGTGGIMSQLNGICKVGTSARIFITI